MLLSLALATAAAVVPAATERVAIDHGGRTLAAHYRAELTVAHKQVGTLAGARQGTRRCDWTAQVTVHRETAAEGVAIPALSRTVADQKAFSGSRMGECDLARAGIAREVAGRDTALQAQLAEAIARDRPALMAELDSLGPVTAARAR